MLNFDDFIDEYNLYNSSGEDLDFIFRVWIFRIIDYPREFEIVFSTTTENPFIWQTLANEADYVFEQEGFFAAEYKPTEDYPFYRVYLYNFTKKGALSLEAISSTLTCDIHTFQTYQLHFRYKDSSLTENFKKWETDIKEQFAPLIDIATGRIDNTKIEQAILLNRQPSGCVVCGSKATGYISTVLMQNNAIFIIANTCDEHQELAKKNPSFLHFLSTLFYMGIDLSSIDMQSKIDEKIIDLICDEIEMDIECTLVKNSYNEAKDEFVLTFERESGVKIILRLHTLMDYGYMVNKPDGKPFQRIDSAPDHKDIKFFPDHLHKTITKNKKPDVESSYTFGFPLLDLPAIKRMVEKLELEFPL